MFGLEKKKKKPFEFDLEKELKKDKKRREEVLGTADKNMQEIKTHLREGAASEDYEHLGILLHGYAALQKVVERVT